MRHPLEVIDFPAPYTDQDTIAHITDRTDALLHNELPAFQVEVGDDFHLAGTLAVQRTIEGAVRALHDHTTDAPDSPPFRFSYQSMRAPFYARPRHARSATSSPHFDAEQVGPAIHKEYAGMSTELQFGYVPEGVELPEFTDDYVGPDLAEIIGTVYEGATQLGRLSIFSQGNEYWDLQPTAHYFMRQADQQVGGRYTRYSMLDPRFEAYPDPDEYDRFTEMRKAASIHLDFRQWELLGEELERHGYALPDETHARYAELVKYHTDNHPGEQYQYWATTNPGDFPHRYGVVYPPTEDPRKPLFFFEP